MYGGTLGYKYIQDLLPIVPIPCFKIFNIIFVALVEVTYIGNYTFYRLLLVYGSSFSSNRQVIDLNV